MSVERTFSGLRYVLNDLRMAMKDEVVDAVSGVGSKKHDGIHHFIFHAHAKIIEDVLPLSFFPLI